ncbi:site-specific integrase [Candidatus Pacearchaeota archaeon]|nr:site-specific integrase [Candidatus Pacearchaeota archaeon]
MSFEDRYKKTKKALLEDNSIIKYNRDLFNKFFAWEEEKLKRQNGLPKIDESSYKTLYGYINKFRNVNNWFKNKAWNKLTEKEIKQVYNDLEDGKIKNRSGRRFEDRRGYYNKVFKSKPFKLAGLSDVVENALEFFTDKRKKQVRFINEEGFKRMLNFLHKPQHYALFWLAWDLGENITALLELRVKHFKRQLNRDTKQEEYLVYLPKENLKRSRQTRSEPTIYPETLRFLDALFKYGKETEYRDEKGMIRRKAVPFKEDDFIFSFKYRQALQIFDSVVKRAGVKCEPEGEKPSWKDLRSGMACYLFSQGWHVEDINLRLGHSPQSKWLESYINYLAINRKRAKKVHYNNNLEDVKDELEESKQREKLVGQRMERQKEDLDQVKELLKKVLEEGFKMNKEVKIKLE